MAKTNGVPTADGQETTSSKQISDVQQLGQDDAQITRSSFTLAAGLLKTLLWLALPEGRSCGVTNSSQIPG